MVIYGEKRFTIMSNSHFDSKEAIAHVVEKQVLGIMAAQEVHGTEIPGHLSAAFDSAKETALTLCLVFVLLSHYQMATLEMVTFILLFFLAVVVWKTGRSASLGWTRLERLHRVISEEKWEIEHHRSQEREELKALYEAKGFHGKLLDDVVDVLMADGDRLLKVMVEEELGLSLERQQHPLKQAFGAFLGSFSAGLVVALSFFISKESGVFIGTLLVIAFSSAFAARYEQNNMVRAVTWNIGIALVSVATAYFLANTLLSGFLR